MRTKKFLLASALILSLTLRFTFADQSKYELSLSNINYTSLTTIEFDIVLYNLSEEKGINNYSSGQYFLEFNPEFANGGLLNYSIVSSDLPESFRPLNASISDNLLCLACNLPQTENAPELSRTGILIARMKLEASSEKFSPYQLNLKWCGRDSKFRSKLCLTDGKAVREIDDSEIQLAGIMSKQNALSKIAEIPKEFSIDQNFPNPFNPVTNLEFGISDLGFVSLKVYDITGKEVATLVNEIKPSGRYEVKFDGSNFASGVYFYKIQTGNYSETRKMFLIK